MKVLLFVFLSTFTNGSFFQSNTLTPTFQHENSFVGEWVIDLRPSPDAAPYLKNLVISKKGEEDYEGTFYGSALQDIYVNESWDKLYFAFKSSDNSNDYFQSGYIIGDKIYGITYCPGRNFVMPWTGERKIKDKK